MGQQPTLSTAADPAWFYIQVLGDGDRTDRVMTVTSDGDVYGHQLLTANDMAVAATQLWRAERSGTGYLFYNRATGRRLALRYDRDRTIAIATTLADATRCVFTLSHAAQGHGDYLNIVASTTPPGADADEVYLHQTNSGGSRDYVIMQVGTAYVGSENSAFRFVPFEDFDIKVSDEASTHWYHLVCTADGRCAAVAADGSARPFVLVESDEASAAQQWKVLENAAGRLTLVNRLTSMVLGTETVTDDNGTVNKLVTTVAGRRIAVYTAHLDYTHYACYYPRGYDGTSWAKLDAPVTDIDAIQKMNLASSRDEEIAAFIADADVERERGTLVLLGGDFNEPSHLDWTYDTRQLYDHHGVVYNWDTSMALQNAGYVDSYRHLFPSAVTHPGFTYPSDNLKASVSKLSWAPEADERERIDFIYYGPDVRWMVTSAAIVGPRGSIVRGQRVTEQTNDTFFTPQATWPSDHKALLIEMTIARE